MTATDELRAMLDERGVEWTSGSTEVSRNICTDLRPDTGVTISVWESRDGKLGIDAHTDYLFTPEQAIEATLGRDTDATRERQGDAGTCMKVYLVETSDDLIESWHPIGVYLHREAADDCAESLRGEYDGIRQFAQVTELKVVDE